MGLSNRYQIHCNIIRLGTIFGKNNRHGLGFAVFDLGRPTPMYSISPIYSIIYIPIAVSFDIGWFLRRLFINLGYVLKFAIMKALITLFMLFSVGVYSQGGAVLLEFPKTDRINVKMRMAVERHPVFVRFMDECIAGSDNKKRPRQCLEMFLRDDTPFEILVPNYQGSSEYDAYGCIVTEVDCDPIFQEWVKPYMSITAGKERLFNRYRSWQHCRWC